MAPIGFEARQRVAEEKKARALVLLECTARAGRSCRAGLPRVARRQSGKRECANPPIAALRDTAGIVDLAAMLGGAGEQYGRYSQGDRAGGLQPTRRSACQCQ
jgi:hypothetical protein